MDCKVREPTIPCDIDPYDEDKAETSFLQSKPLSFIITGKPGSGKSSLAAKLRDHFRCPLIQGDELIKEAILSGSELGIELSNLLLNGQAVPDSTIYQLLTQKLASKPVAHLGYVLEGPPCFSTVVSVRDRLQTIKTSAQPPQFIVNIKISREDLEARRVDQKIDPVTGIIYTKQIYDPLPIIKDKVRKSRTSAVKKVDREQTDSEEGEDDKDEGEGEDDEEGGEGERGESEGLSPEILSRLMSRKEDEPSRVKKDLEKYEQHVLPYLKDFISSHDQQYVIELDGNKTTDVLLKELVRRVNIHSLSVAVRPVRLMEPEKEEEVKDSEEEKDQPDKKPADQELLEKALVRNVQATDPSLLQVGGGEEEEGGSDDDDASDVSGVEPGGEEEGEGEVYDIEDDDELMHAVGGQHLVTPGHRWRRSRWNRLCPVQLRQGNIVKGKAEYAVGFLDKMYILSSQEAMNKFIENPREFLLPPQPRQPCKLFVLGPPYSGKTTLCRKIANKYNAQVIDVLEVLKRETEKLKSMRYEEIKERVKQIAVEMVKEQMHMDLLHVGEDGEGGGG